MYQENLYKLSCAIIEISYHLLFDFKKEDIPLFKSYDVFINKIANN